MEAPSMAKLSVLQDTLQIHSSVLFTSGIYAELWPTETLETVRSCASVQSCDQ